MDKMKIDEKTALVLEGGIADSIPVEYASRQECGVQQDDGADRAYGGWRKIRTSCAPYMTKVTPLHNN